VVLLSSIKATNIFSKSWFAFSTEP
jgi:hypothetical protein